MLNHGPLLKDRNDYRGTIKIFDVNDWEEIIETKILYTSSNRICKKSVESLKKKTDGKRLSGNITSAVCLFIRCDIDNVIVYSIFLFTRKKIEYFLFTLDLISSSPVELLSLNTTIVITTHLVYA